jgi:general nucleoside transport system permease protein
VARLRIIAVQLLPVAIALMAALGLVCLIAMLLHVSIPELGRIMAARFATYSWGQVLFQATFLTFTGLAVALAFSVGLFNIGAEGQAVVGSLACALVALHTGGLPSWLGLLLAIVAAFAGGAMWGVIPGWLRARFGSHEVINTIMLNFIAIAGANYLMARWLSIPETVRTASVPVSLPRLSELFPAFQGSAANFSLLLALVAVVAAHFFLHHTPLGFSLRAVGKGRRQAEIAGINAGKRYILAFLIAGGFAGMVGTNFVLGYKHYYEDGFTGGIGFMGIAVALIARNQPLAIFPAALLFGFLSQAGLVVNTHLPREVVDVITGAILLVFIASDRYRMRWLRNLRTAQVLRDFALTRAKGARSNEGEGGS